MNHVIAEKIVQQYAEIIRSEYCAARNKWHREHERKKTNWGATLLPKYDGGTDSSGREHQSLWRRAAVFVIQHRLNPGRFVRAQFAIRLSKPIEPTQLLNVRAVELYEAQEQIDSSEIARLFHMQKEQALVEMDKLKPCRASRGWTDVDIRRSVIGNGMIPLSALFRYCIARKEGDDDLADAFYAEALIQFLSQPDDYERIWIGWLPNEIRMHARQLTDYVAAPKPADPLEENQPNVRALIMD